MRGLQAATPKVSVMQHSQMRNDAHQPVPLKKNKKGGDQAILVNRPKM